MANTWHVNPNIQCLQGMKEIFFVHRIMGSLRNSPSPASSKSNSTALRIAKATVCFC